MTKRPYNRRSEEERIEELAARIEHLKQRMEQKQRKDGPVLKEMPKLRKALVRFSEIAMECERADLSMSTQAFLAGLERTVGDVPDEPRRRGRAPRNSLLSIS
jgi:hypothetical protein